MITREEFENLQAGDQVRIVSEWNDNSDEANTGEMDRYLGVVMTVDRFASSREVHMVEDHGEWYWNRYCIEEIVSEDDDELAFASDEDFMEAYSLLLF